MGKLDKPAVDKEEFAKMLGEAVDMCVYPESVTSEGESIFAMARRGIEKELLIISSRAGAGAAFAGSERGVSLDSREATIKFCPLTHKNAEALRECLSFTKPGLVGLEKSFGAGDRLGIATPGHVLAVKKAAMRPFFCQQSIREVSRTGRTAAEVMDCASWGVFQAGWRDGFGADADHLKTTEDIDTCLQQGYTFYTVDPGEYVDDGAASEPGEVLREKFDALPWDLLQSSPEETAAAYGDKEFSVPELKLTITGDELLRIAVKYGRAIAHAMKMYQHLVEKAGEGKFDFEVSVDETDSPTSAAEHYYIAAELKRLGVKYQSLAPRFVGEFEKGVDYIGDLEEFRKEFSKHVAIARHLGPYKISLHSGSDKFSIYPIAAELAGDLVHLKTAGTSYLEALRAIATVQPELFRQILSFAKTCYTADRASYHVSAKLENVPQPEELDESELPQVLDQFDTREVCHVTYGSVLTKKYAYGEFVFYDRFMKVLRENEGVYYKILEKHIGRHIKAFS